MRHVFRTLIPVLFFCLCLSGAVHAEDTVNPNLYQIVDVVVDVNADTASHARDKAVLQAQRDAFSHLVARVGGDAKLADQQSDDTIASFVQAFEVQQEKSSATRYLGTFTVQFKPMAVRTFLNKRGVTYSEAKGRPVVVVPLVNINGQIFGGEEATKWRNALEEAAKGASAVPLILPPVESEAALFPLSMDAVSSKGDTLANLAKKYQAPAIALAVLSGDADKPDATKPMDATVSLFDYAGKPGEVLHMPQQTVIDRATAQKYLTETARQVRNAVEKAGSAKSRAPTSHLVVTAPIETLTLWNETKRKLDGVSFLTKASVLSLTRMAAKMDLEYHGELAELKDAVSAEGLSLTQTENGWVLQEQKPVP